METEQAIKLIRDFDLASTDLTNATNNGNRGAKGALKRFDKARRDLFKALTGVYPSANEEKEMNV